MTVRKLLGEDTFRCQQFYLLAVYGRARCSLTLESVCCDLLTWQRVFKKVV